MNKMKKLRIDRKYTSYSACLKTVRLKMSMKSTCLILKTVAIADFKRSVNKFLQIFAQIVSIVKSINAPAVMIKLQLP